MSWLKTAFVAAQGLGVAAQAYGAYTTARANKKQAKFVRQAAQQQASAKRRETQRHIAKIRSQYTASGISLDSNTVSEILSEQEQLGVDDANDILALGNAEAKALNEGAQGALIGGGLSMGASFFGGYSNYKIAQKRGWF